MKEEQCMKKDESNADLYLLLIYTSQVLSVQKVSWRGQDDQQ